MNVKKIVIYVALLVLALAMAFCFTGCEPKEVISLEEFKEIAGKRTGTIVDVTEQYSQYPSVKSATVAKSSDGWQIEFFQLDSDEDAIDMFKYNMKTFEDQKGNISSSSSTEFSNYSTYSMSTDGKYMHICRIDNTFLYLRVDKEYKKAVEAIVEDLGY